MASSQIVEFSRRITRQLDLGNGMFFDADMLRVLAECGAVELIQKGNERSSARVGVRAPRLAFVLAVAALCGCSEHEREATFWIRCAPQVGFGTETLTLAIDPQRAKIFRLLDDGHGHRSLIDYCGLCSVSVSPEQVTAVADDPKYRYWMGVDRISGSAEERGGADFYKAYTCRPAREVKGVSEPKPEF